MECGACARNCEPGAIQVQAGVGCAAAVILGKWNPVGALAAAFLFGAAEALQLFVQSYGLGVPYQIPTMLPYVLALAVLAGFVSRAIPPAAEGIPYQQEER